MDRRERYGDPETVMRAILDNWQSKIYTAFPGIITAYDAATQSCSIQPAIEAVVRLPDQQESSYVAIPLLVDCPVVFPGGGGFTLTFPIAVGDEVLVVIANRCIDAWWAYGGVQVPQELRMHDLSDGFALPNLRSKPRALSGASTANAQLRNDANTVHVELTSTAVNIIASGNVTVTAGGNANVTATGTATIQAAAIKLQATGAALKKLINSAFITFFNNHVHTGPGGNTGVPTVAASAAQETSVVEAE